MEGSIAKYFLNSFVFLLAITSFIKSSSGDTRFNNPSRPKSINTEFIRTSCSSTTYPKLCYTSLVGRASLIQTSPKLLAYAALNVTLAMAKSTSVFMKKLSKGGGLNPMEVGAMQDCLEELSDSVDELRSSVGEMGQIKAANFEVMMSDIETWVSAALTDETTCSDGFKGNTVNGKMVRSRIVNIAHMTSNALALINSYASVRA